MYTSCGMTFRLVHHNGVLEMIVLHIKMQEKYIVEHINANI
jgi:hypothetical protein